MTDEIEVNDMADNVGPPSPKRQCLMEPSVNAPSAKDRVEEIGKTMPHLEMPLPIPQPVGQLNVRQLGGIHHDYGTGHQQVNITHCVGGMNSQQLGGLGIPQVYVQPDLRYRNNTDYSDFNRKVENQGGFFAEDYHIQQDHRQQAPVERHQYPMPSLNPPQRERPGCHETEGSYPTTRTRISSTRTGLNGSVGVQVNPDKELHRTTYDREVPEGDSEDLSAYNMQAEGATQYVPTNEPNQDPRPDGEVKAEMNYLYQKGEGMLNSQSMQAAIKRVLQEKIFKSVKFLPRNNTMFKYPDFVEGMVKKEKTVIIINGVLEKMNLSHYNVAQKTRFWITYGELFRDYFTHHRSATQELIKKIFLERAQGFKSENERDQEVLLKLKDIVQQEPRKENTVPKKDVSGRDIPHEYEPALKGGLMDLRDGDYDEVLEYIIIHCFKAPLMRQAWEYDSKLKCVSAFVTVYDEALVYLMIENSLMLWDEMSSRGTKSKDCHVRPKYTCSRGKNVGWSSEGMRRFNRLIKCVREQRAKGMGYAVEKLVLAKLSVNPRGVRTGEENENIDVLEEEEAAFEIMD